jgi:hypothetical protein
MENDPFLYRIYRALHTFFTGVVYDIQAPEDSRLKIRPRDDRALMPPAKFHFIKNQQMKLL